MKKPISLIVYETKQKIIDIINTSGLPPFILELILKDFYEQITKLNEQQMNEEKNLYENSIQKSKSKEE